jgi:hypothetical protein
MQKKLVTFVGLALVCAVAAFAHGNKKHVMGTVEKVSPDLVVVKTSAGKSVDVKLTSSTVYISAAGGQEKPATLADLVVGDRVVIHATPTGETLSADEVKFSPAGSSAHSAGASSKPN